MSILKTFVGNQCGFSTVRFGAAAVLVVFAVGSLLDLSRFFHSDLALQDAVNSAALAAVVAAEKSDIERAQIAREVFAAGIRDMKFYDTRPKAVVKTGSSAINVTASVQVPTLFMKIAHLKTMTAHQSATAQLVGRAPVCVLALDSSGSPAVSWNGSGQFVAEKCGIHSNSAKANGMRSDGAKIVRADSYCVIGGYSGTHFSSVPATDCAPVADPFAGLPRPRFGACHETNLEISGKITTLQPGVYCGGIKISDRSHVTLKPGTYIMRGGPFEVATRATVIGEGVTLYLYGNDTGIDVAPGTFVTLTAPEAGDYAGIIITQESNANPGHQSRLMAGGNIYLVGTTHLPTQKLLIAGKGEFRVYAPSVAIVAKQVEFAGSQNTTIKLDPSSIADQPHRTRPILSAQLKK